MWNFEMSYVGTAISIFVIAFSLFVEWIYMANVRIKYQKIERHSKVSPIKNAKNILDQKKLKVHFRRGNNFFFNDLDITKKRIRLEERIFFNNSLYDNVNSVFLSYKYFLMKDGQWKSRVTYIAKISIAFLSINLIWTMFFGLWIIIAVLWILYAIIAFIFILINFNIDLKATKFSLEYLKLQTDQNLFVFVKKYIKYKRIESFINLFRIFTTPTIDFIRIVRDWGRNE